MNLKTYSNIRRPFNFVCDVVKTDEQAEKKSIIGVASNTFADLAQEKMSKACIQDMKDQVNSGRINLQPDHYSEWQDIMGVFHEASVSGEDMIVRADLNMEEEFCQKLWKKLKGGAQIGLSIGGWIMDAHEEFDESLRKTIRVIDKILLNHIVPTGRPCNPRTFVQAVGKSLESWKPQEDESMKLEQIKEKLASLAKSVKDTMKGSALQKDFLKEYKDLSVERHTLEGKPTADAEKLASQDVAELEKALAPVAEKSVPVSMDLSKEEKELIEKHRAEAAVASDPAMKAFSDRIDSVEKKVDQMKDEILKAIGTKKSLAANDQAPTGKKIEEIKNSEAFKKASPAQREKMLEDAAFGGLVVKS